MKLVATMERMVYRFQQLTERAARLRVPIPDGAATSLAMLGEAAQVIRNELSREPPAEYFAHPGFDVSFAAAIQVEQQLDSLERALEGRGPGGAGGLPQ